MSAVQCDGFMSGEITMGFMERCSCNAKYSVTQENGPLIRRVCGRHVQTFLAGKRQGRRYKISKMEPHNE